MASDWFTCTNTVLKLASLDAVSDRTTFNNELEGLDKYQQNAKYAVMLANQYLGARAFRYFTKRRIQLPIVAGQSIYPLDTGISAENLSARTFFNVSTTAPASSQNRELRAWDYTKFLQWTSSNPTLPTGPPTRWILLPLWRENVPPVLRVQIYPTPDQNYQLEYEAKINSTQLKLDTDVILFPPEYEHIVWMFAMAQVESDLGEGKQQQMGALAKQAADEVRLVAGRPIDVRTAPRYMHIPSWNSRHGYMSSPPDVDANGNLID